MKRTVQLEKKLKGGQVVQIISGDLTREKCGAIVNAANSQLQHGAGVAKSICNAGGAQVQKDCDAWIKKHGDVKTGHVIWTEGCGKLQCDWIFHAVGPIWAGGMADEETSLESCVNTCLQFAEKKELTDIAFPAISSGIFGFPKKLCAQIMLRCIYNYFWENNDSVLTRIAIITADSQTATTLADVLRAGYKTWGKSTNPTPSPLKAAPSGVLRYVRSDITHAAPGETALLCHAVAPGKTWSPKGIMGKLVKKFGTGLTLAYNHAIKGSGNQLGSVQVVDVTDDMKPTPTHQYLIANMFVVDSKTLDADLAAWNVALKTLAAKASKFDASVHIEKFKGNWSAFHKAIEKHLPHIKVYVYTSDGGECKKYNDIVKGAPSSSSSSSSSSRRRPRADDDSDEEKAEDGDEEEDEPAKKKLKFEDEDEEEVQPLVRRRSSRLAGIPPNPKFCFNCGCGLPLSKQQAKFCPGCGVRLL
eukprot:TRINITY_DN60823_c0_g1_i1.p1 TRINITY_DN60823_c0_g1~~TRINITY_DN60823_c0_g1_i1.p1  ORF type:complete len:509 (-),score=52.91 TRINITY_DN60823_c0_g1_i1:123-1541(-)